MMKKYLVDNLGRLVGFVNCSKKQTGIVEYGGQTNEIFHCSGTAKIVPYSSLSASNKAFSKYADLDKWAI